MKRQTGPIPLLNSAVFILSLAGFIMAIYVLQSFLKQSSIFCLSGGGCDAVRKSTASYPFGIPVPLFGAIGYLLLTILALFRSSSKNINILKSMFAISLFGICFVSWFTYTELFVIHGICMWCGISTIVMYIVFGLILWQIRINSHERNIA